jgi:RND superfamily putative drug exporter
VSAVGSADGVAVSLTGAAARWSDFNAANRSAMMKSELLSWPVTLAILVPAFGSLAAAGLLTLLTHGFEISMWAMNFALTFALALGIDYAPAGAEAHRVKAEKARRRYLEEECACPPAPTP